MNKQQKITATILTIIGLVLIVNQVINDFEFVL